MTTRARRRLRRTLVPLLLAGAAAGTAWGFWTGTVAPGSGGSAAATELQQAGTPIVTVDGSAVTLSWSRTTHTDGTPVTDYTVTRRDSATGTPQVVGAGCAGTITTTSCTEQSVPDGSWTYALTPRAGVHWTGPVGPSSDVVVVDTTGPTGGSVDATGLGGTGARYATSQSLALALAPGTDPSGLATSGRRLLRADAPLTASGTTNGACGTWTSEVEVAVDPAATYDDVVPLTGRCYRYRYVVADTRGNTTTYTSPDIKVDTSAPAVPTVAAAGISNSYGTGSTVYYRPTAPGSLRLTATATDAQSGIASYALPTLGTGWTRTGTNPATYSWTAGPTQPGLQNVSATNHAGSTSAAGSTTVLADGSAPSGGSVSYLDGPTTAARVNVTLVTGTDAGSGIGSRVLQRSTAPLDGDGTCGAFGAFATVANGSNPASPFSDGVSPGRCYRYQYVVTDRVGNVQAYGSAAVAKVSESPYAAVVRATSGLTSFWRLGEALLAQDSFGGPAGSHVHNRSGELSGWSRFEYSTTNAVLTAAGRARRESATSGGTQGVAVYSTAMADTADYTVGADLYVASLLPGDAVALTGRFTAANYGTSYAGGYDLAKGAWELQRIAGGVRTTLAMSPAAALEAGRTYRLELELKGRQVRLLVDGVAQVSHTDSSTSAITNPGEGGFGLGYGVAASAAPTETTGFQLDNFRLTPLAADAVGPNGGSFLGTPTLGGTSAVSGDQDTSASLDGDDAAAFTAPLGNAFTLELWFRSSQGTGTSGSWLDGARLIEAAVPGTTTAGVSLRSDGHLAAGTGTTTVLSTAGGLNDGLWHHVAFTRAADGTLVLYVDGVAVGTASDGGSATAGQATLTLGRSASVAGRHVVGSLDEVALYGAALDATVVAQHVAAR